MHFVRKCVLYCRLLCGLSGFKGANTKGCHWVMVRCGLINVSCIYRISIVYLTCIYRSCLLFGHSWIAALTDRYAVRALRCWRLRVCDGVLGSCAVGDCVLVGSYVHVKKHCAMGVVSIAQ